MLNRHPYLDLTPFVAQNHSANSLIIILKYVYEGQVYLNVYIVTVMERPLDKNPELLDQLYYDARIGTPDADTVPNSPSSIRLSTAKNLADMCRTPRKWQYYICDHTDESDE